VERADPVVQPPNQWIRPIVPVGSTSSSLPSGLHRFTKSKFDWTACEASIFKERLTIKCALHRSNGQKFALLVNFGNLGSRDFGATFTDLVNVFDRS
jgi:hypothetical protein